MLARMYCEATVRILFKILFPLTHQIDLSRLGGAENNLRRQLTMIIYVCFVLRVRLNSGKVNVLLQYYHSKNNVNYDYKLVFYSLPAILTH